MIEILTIFRIEKVGVITVFLILILRMLLISSILNLISLIVSVTLKLKHWAINLAIKSLQSIWGHSHYHLLLFMNVIILLLLGRVPVHFWPAETRECMGLPAWVNVVVEHIENELDAWAWIHFAAVLDARGFWYFVVVVERYIGVAYVTFIFIHLIVWVVENCMLILDELRFGILKIWFLKILIPLTTVGVIWIRNHFLRNLKIIFILKNLLLLILHLKLKLFYHLDLFFILTAQLLFFWWISIVLTKFLRRKKFFWLINLICWIL